MKPGLIGLRQDTAPTSATTAAGSTSESSSSLLNSGSKAHAEAAPKHKVPLIRRSPLSVLTRRCCRHQLVYGATTNAASSPPRQYGGSSSLNLVD